MGEQHARDSGEGGTDVPDTASVPSISGPPSTSRKAPPPTFSVNAGPGWYFAVELAASPDLFDTGSAAPARDPDNFYGSWSDTPLMQGTKYTLPAEVWKHLKYDERLYYRICCSSSPDAWDDYQVSSHDTDGTSIPAILIAA